MLFSIGDFFYEVFQGADSGDTYSYIIEFLTVTVTSMFGLFAILLIPAIVWILIKFIVSCARF